MDSVLAVSSLEDGNKIILFAVVFHRDSLAECRECCYFVELRSELSLLCFPPFPMFLHQQTNTSIGLKEMLGPVSSEAIGKLLGVPSFLQKYFLSGHFRTFSELID